MEMNTALTPQTEKLVHKHTRVRSLILKYNRSQIYSQIYFDL